MTITCEQYLKILVIKVDTFSSEIIDESNFRMNDEFSITKYIHQYIKRDDCIIQKILM